MTKGFQANHVQDFQKQQPTLMPPPMYQANAALPPIPPRVEFADNISSPFAMHINLVIWQTKEFPMTTRIYDGQD